MFHKSSIAVSQIALPDVSTFECLAVSIASDSHKVILVVIYRPGSATITRSFYDEFENVVCTVMAINQNFALVGDFNVHVDDATDVHGSRLRCIFNAYGLHQHVQMSTHSHGHTLDLIVTADTTSLSDLGVSDMCHLSDHKCIDFNLPYSATNKEVRTLTTRNWSAFDIAEYVNELATSELATTTSNDVNYLFILYNSTMTTLIDRHAPQRTVTRRHQHRAP